MTQKSLKDLCIRMTEYKSIKLLCPGVCGPGRTHSHTSVSVRSADTFTTESSADSRPGIFLGPCLVKKPQVNLPVAKKDPEQFHRSFSLSFILSVRPRLRHFAVKGLVVQPPDCRAVSSLLVKSLRQIPLGFRSCPINFINPNQMLNKLNMVGALIRSDFPRTTGTGALCESGAYRSC
jgi:hypothetical protein